MPMQPSPSADTSSPWPPSARVLMSLLLSRWAPGAYGPFARFARPLSPGLGIITSWTSSSGHSQSLLAYPYRVARAQLAPTTDLALLVYPYGLDRKEGLRFTAAIYRSHQLQQLAESDRLVPNRHLARHGVNLSVMGEA